MANPCWWWDLSVITNVMITCVILHNMVIKVEQGKVLEPTIEVPNDIQTRWG
jgi:hypothetical protein